MHSDEKVPVLVMSRSKGMLMSDDQPPVLDSNGKPGNNSVATGGRAMKYRRPSWGRPNTDAWPPNPDEALDPAFSEQPAKRQKTKVGRSGLKPSPSIE